jgi:hypothetical protein
MSLSDLASLGSFVSGVAVLATLCFLVLQMRQTSKNQIAQVQQARSIRHITTILAQADPVLAEAVAGALRGDPNLTPGQVQAFVAYSGAMFWTFEDSFIQHSNGQLDDAAWMNDEATLRAFVAIPAYRAGWLVQRRLSSGPYANFVDALISETTPTKLGDFSQAWNITMAQQVAAAEGADSHFLLKYSGGTDRSFLVEDRGHISTLRFTIETDGHKRHLMDEL